MATAVGRTPVRLRVGVTGHRALPDEQSITVRVDEVLARLQRMLPSTPATPVVFEVVSPLGEGADRIVAERVLQVPQAILEVPLPLARSDYEQDFGSAGSRERFSSLLERAERVWVVGRDRVDAYRETGIYVVDSCDVLIAIWDGQPSRGPGGTEDVLRLARRRGMPVFVIHTQAPFDVQEEQMPASFQMIQDVDRFNRVDVTHAAFVTQPLPSWAKAPFRRASAKAKRCRLRFLWISRAMFLSSALAILAVAVSIVSSDESVARAFAYLEVASIATALALWLAVRRRLHSRWITSRFLAERLRSAAFLALVGANDQIEPRPQGEHHGNAQEWLTRVFREVWRSRPPVDPADQDVSELRDLLRDAWVDPQIAYYRRRARDHEAAFRILTVASGVLFAATIVSAALHALELVEGTVSDAVVILSVALPAFAGALTGIAALEQHARHAERFRLMSQRLEELRDRLERVTDLEAVRNIAFRIEAELRTEGEAWIDVMRFQDVDLPV